MSDGLPVFDGVKFLLDGREVSAAPGETIWAVAKREGVAIPHLCHADQPGYRPDGNCRACMVEIDGERVLAASCVRKPTAGMKVSSASERAVASQKLVFELLMADQPRREVAPDPASSFWKWSDRIEISESRFPVLERLNKASDFSHPAMAVQLDACIQCNLCVRACREVQVNDVIGMAFRGADEKVVFDFDDPMGGSTCVACGECVQACPTGALMEKSLVDEAGVFTNAPDRKVDSVCPYCGVGCQLTYEIKEDRIVCGPGPRRALEPEPAVRERSLRLRLRPPCRPPDRAPDPARGRVEARRRHRSREPVDAFSRGDLGGGDGARRRWFAPHPRPGRRQCARRVSDQPRAPTRRRTSSRSSSAPALEPTTSTIARASATPRRWRGCSKARVGRGLAPFMAAKDADVIVVIGANPIENHPVAATFFKNAVERGAKLIVMDPRGVA
jgi:formate dehydrogenase major subunit